jgi:hypothetical protein
MFEGTDFKGFWENESYMFEGFTYPKCKLQVGEAPPKTVGILDFRIMSISTLGSSKVSFFTSSRSH